jgi:eukaryotic-like serine/threonine-protein kinase
MSDVFLAEDVELGRRVALKLLGPSADPIRFEREARAAAALTHPNVNQLFDYGKVGERPYMVLEYLPGGTLEDRLRSGKPLSDDETRAIAAGLAAGLAHAHERGLVHRDLKPSNVLFDAEGRPKIADFGIARMGDAGTLTEAGTVMGTAAYISPEQAAGEPATPASDVYSLGVILFRMLTGRLPFTAQQPLELAAMHRDLPAPAVESFRGDVPPGLAGVVNSALAKDPADRPPDGAALAAALGAPVAPVEETATVVLPPPPPPPPRPPARRRSPYLVPAVIGLVALIAAGIAAAVIATRDTSSSPKSTTTSSTRSSTHRTTTTTTTTQPTSSSTTTTTTSTTTTTTRPTTTHHTTTTPPPPPPTPPPPPPPPPPPTTVTTPPPPPPPTTTEVSTSITITGP